jgi:hypothetical protein
MTELHNGKGHSGRSVCLARGICNGAQRRLVGDIRRYRAESAIMSRLPGLPVLGLVRSSRGGGRPGPEPYCGADRCGQGCAP